MLNGIHLTLMIGPAVPMPVSPTPGVLPNDSVPCATSSVTVSVSPALASDTLRLVSVSGG